ncbi:MAG: hypothetical protein NC311_02920 [Muribaculaceae bacterium]|nr:hypothetical protein [Muribaculaceae bacterium]
MNKNIILINLKKTALCSILPLLMAACGEQKNTNVDAELADTDAKLESVEQKLTILVQQTDSLALDSLPRNPRSIELSEKITHYKQGLNKVKKTSPKDSVRIKAFNKKIGSLLIDSIMNANHVKEQIVKNHHDEFHALYNEQDMLRARRDSLMKIKTR